MYVKQNRFDIVFVRTGLLFFSSTSSPLYAKKAACMPPSLFGMCSFYFLYILILQFPILATYMPLDSVAMSMFAVPSVPHTAESAMIPSHVHMSMRSSAANPCKSSLFPLNLMFCVFSLSIAWTLVPGSSNVMLSISSYVYSIVVLP
jgi:hypothetical protein